MDITGFVAWLFGLVKAAVRAFGSVIGDALLVLLDGIFSALGAVVAALPSPSFLSQSDVIGNLLSGLPPYALWCIGQMHIPEAFAIIGAGVAFRLGRKLATLGQW